MARPRPLIPKPVFGHLAGVDEAGRGPLAGPVVVAAVMLADHHGLQGLDDSKRLTQARREALFPQIIQCAIAYSIQVIEVEDIERLNILHATLLGMQRAVLALSPAPGLTLIDGNRAPELPGEVQTMVQGDRWVPAISAASILAKVKRDEIMQGLHRQYPGYGFDRNKGYPTAEHLACLQLAGPCPSHRRTYAPVRAAMDAGLFD